MEISTIILNELTAISPTVAAINKVNPYTVPNGYFDTLSNEILAQTFREHNAVPEGYFNDLANSILNKIKADVATDAANELRILSPLLYSIQTEDKLFSVPKSYFKELPDEVLQRISKETASEEISYLSPLLSGVQHKNVFTVPHDYFNDLYSGIQSKLKPQAKIVSFGKRRSSIFKYAVAAAVTGVMALTVFKFSGSGNTKLAMPEYATKGLQIKAANVDAALAALSNDDIADYLQDNGDGIDAKTLANAATDDKSLPSEFDYLSDDKALDNFLNNVTVEDLKN